MRRALLVLLTTATGLGCQGIRFGRFADARCQPVCPPGAPAPWGAAPCAPAAQPPCPPPQPPCPPAQPRQPREAKAPPEEVETRSATAAVTQDILLIPRTVYVPYAPHVPVAPARLALAAPAGRVTQTEERTRELAPTTLRELETRQPREAPPPAHEALDKCLQEMRRLNQRIAELESRAAPQPCPAPCPGPGMCPVPGLGAEPPCWHAPPAAAEYPPAVPVPYYPPVSSGTPLPYPTPGVPSHVPPAGADYPPGAVPYYPTVPSPSSTPLPYPTPLPRAPGMVPPQPSPRD